MKRHPALTVFVALFLATAPAALAHPGHDGDHDLVWDFTHLATHPLATFGCLVVLGAIGWIAWRMVRTSVVTQAKAAKVVRRDR